jgi:hypothetical protein
MFTVLPDDQGFPVADGIDLSPLSRTARIHSDHRVMECCCRERRRVGQGAALRGFPTAGLFRVPDGEAGS